MEFSKFLESALVVTEHYGGHVTWTLTILLGLAVTICLHYVVKKYQTRHADDRESLNQSDQVVEPRAEDMSFVEDVSLQAGQESLTSPIFKKEQFVDDHESTFLIHREQYKKHVNVEHIKLTQRPEEDFPLTIFEEIGEFKRLKKVTIIGFRLGYPSLLRLLQCTSIRSLKLVSCQIACVPRSLANLKDLEILDLSHNNLTTLPGRSIHSLSCLKILNVSHNKITTIGGAVRKLRTVQNFDVSFNEITEIPYEILEMQNLKTFSCSHNKIAKWLDPSNEKMQANTGSLQSLNLSNNLFEEVPRYVKDLKNISVVNISGNKIGRANMSDEILSQQLAELFYLPSVSKLLLGNNSIKTLPSLDTAKVSPNIELIDLMNNEIQEVPAALLLMSTLKVLLLADNKITKIPTDLDLNKLSPTLCVIDLSNNVLDDLPLALCFLTSLERLDLTQNKISTISENVKSCKSLSFLDVSGNKLKEIPPHVIDLPKLVEIHASNNQITSVSSLTKGESSVVEVVALAENGLSHFPEALTQMKKLKKVDLSNNGIKVIPQSVMDMPKDVKLNLRDNPITDPPLQVCQAGLEAIQAFYEDLTTASSITQCLKTLFLGTYEAGKTSLVRVFQLNRSKLTKPEERTHGIEIAELHLSAPNISDITLSVWDFAGQETYYITHQFFLSAKALMLLIVDLEKYNSANFDSTCGKWLENMIAKVGNPVVIPVATHIDKLSEEEVKYRCEDLARKLEAQERIRINDLERQLQRIDESVDESTETVRDRKKQIEYLLQERPTIHAKPVPVSSAEPLQGIQYLKQVILNYAVNKEYFPEVGRRIPRAWADTEACVERKGEELSLPYMTWNEFTALLKENVPNLQPESRIKTVAQYLHDTGKILWYSDIESLRNHVFLKPASLVDIFRKVFRHDLEIFIDYESDPRYREAEITSAEFQKMKNDLVNKGELHTKLLRCLWSDVEKKCHSGSFEAIFDVLIKLMKQFDLCYDLCVQHDDGDEQQQVFYMPLSLRKRLLARAMNDVIEDKQQYPIPRTLLSPWHIKKDRKDKAESQWKSGGSPIISLEYQFPSFIPPGLFARLTVRAHRPEHNLHFVSHWNTGALCKHRKNQILVLLENKGTKGLVVSLSARLESRGMHARLESRGMHDHVRECRFCGSEALHNLWNILKELSLEVEDLLKQWPGVLVGRSTVCPECHRPSFPGNWLHSRSSRRSDEKVICPLCNNRVSVEHLLPLQPRQRRDPYRDRRSRRRFAITGYDPAMDSWYHALLNQRVADAYVSRQLSDRQLLRVAERLGAEWESLAIHMGFTTAHVYKFKCDHPHSTEQQIFTMLTTWRERMGRNATRLKLWRVLQEAGVDHDAISCLDEMEMSFEWEADPYDDEDDEYLY